MTIYWSRCMVCGKHKPTARCTIGRSQIDVCPSCYYLLGLWRKCSEKPWGSGPVREAGAVIEERKLRELEKLLEKLE